MLRWLAILCALPTLALANDGCDDLWFTRNLIFDQAGYCFGSPLGQAVFDNSDCTTNAPQLSEPDRARIAAIKAEEARWDCRVDTSKATLDIHNLPLRRRLDVQPLKDFTESSCMDYLGTGFPLYAAPRDDSRIIGFVQPGDSILNSHMSFDQDAQTDWSFVSQTWAEQVERPDLGWTNVAYWRQCQMNAG